MKHDEVIKLLKRHRREWKLEKDDDEQDYIEVIEVADKWVANIDAAIACLEKDGEPEPPANAKLRDALQKCLDYLTADFDRTRAMRDSAIDAVKQALVSISKIQREPNPMTETKGITMREVRDVLRKLSARDPYGLPQVMICDTGYRLVYRSSSYYFSVAEHILDKLRELRPERLLDFIAAMTR